MKNLRKILIISIIMIFLGITVLPVMKDLLITFNINGNVLLSFLNSVTDSVIVKASDEDYNYSGNLYVMYHNHRMLDYQLGAYVYTESAGVPLEYSVNDGEYKECEYLWYGSTILNLDKDVNTVTVRHKETGDIVLESVVKMYKDKCITLDKAKIGWEKGARIHVQNNDYNRISFEYSLDNGETFNELTGWDEIPSLYQDILIIREKYAPENIAYRSPEITENDIEESYTYENGKTKIKFKLKDDDNNKAEYSYEINGEEKTGSEFEVEEDTSVKLKVKTVKEFMEISGEKEIEVKVIKTEKPVITQVAGDNFSISAGEIVNDTLGKIYYSLDDSEPVEYSDKVKLNPGVHTVKAYQLTENYNVKSDEAEEEFMVEDNFDVLTDLIEEYTYENGKTVLNFKLPEDKYGEENVQFSYVIDGEEKNGNEVIAESDTDVKLKIAIIKPYKTYNFEKDINVKVVKVEKPAIQQINDEEIKITAGEITNDTLDKIFYMVDDGEENEFTKEFVLAPGVHTIKAYQTSKEKNVKSDEAEFEITIEEPTDDDNNGNTNNDDEENTSNNGNTNNDDEENNNNNGNTNSDDEENNNNNGNASDDNKENNNNNENTGSDDKENNNNNGNEGSGGKNITIIVEDGSATNDESKTSDEESNNGNNLASDNQKSASQKDDQNSDNKKSENDKEIVDNNENANKEIDNINAPKTSDEISMFVALLICVIAINVVINKKSKKQK